MISIITPVYNNPEEVKNLLESISRSEGVDFPFEAIVVDDGSKDNSIKGIAESYDFVRYIRLEENRGAAAARNAGAKAARYDNLLYFDSDVTVFPETLAKAKRHFDNNEVRSFIGRIDSIPQNDGFFPRYKAYVFNSWLPKGGFSTVFTPVAGGIRRKTLLSSGGFDEAIKGATVEYVRFSYALSKLCSTYFYPDLVVRVKLNPFRKALWTDFYSTMKWVEMFDDYRRFDNHCTSVGGALGRLSGFVAVVSLPACLVLRLYLVWAALFAVFFYLNRSLFIPILRRESPLFFLRAVITYMILSVVTVAGGIAGLAIVIRKRIAKIFS